MHWPSGRGIRQARDLLLHTLIPLARDGLGMLGLADDGDQYLDMFEERVTSGLTGAVWQQKSLAANGGDFRLLMANYCERQRSRAPVYQWVV
jgi:hypothetical protein